MIPYKKLEGLVEVQDVINQCRASIVVDVFAWGWGDSCDETAAINIPQTNVKLTSKTFYVLPLKEFKEPVIVELADIKESAYIAELKDTVDHQLGVITKLRNIVEVGPLMEINELEEEVSDLKDTLQESKDVVKGLTGENLQLERKVVRLEAVIGKVVCDLQEA